jgi:tRNA-dihydrouridine synthase
LPNLYSSPLQGFTDFRFRNAFEKFFGGIDTYYAPYIRLNGKLEIKPVYERDLALKNNETISLIPQVMTNDADEFLFVANYIQSLGHSELNWNLGCPYPMVTNRGMGSGLIQDVARIEQILQRVYTETDVIISLKMRLGYEVPTEILAVLDMLEKFPIKNVAIHARLGEQLYKGGVDLDGFQKCIDRTKHLLYYNGDVKSVQDYHRLKDQFPSIENWMIGRGLIADPFLPQMIKANTFVYPTNRSELFKQFHCEIFEAYQESLSGFKHVQLKMLSYWEYFTSHNEDSNRIMRKIKKSKNAEDLENNAREIIEEYFS